MSTYLDEYGSKVLSATWHLPVCDEDIQVKYDVLNGNEWSPATAKNVPAVVYCLPEVIQGNRVIIADSEPNVFTLEKALEDKVSAGYVVTCWPALLNRWPEPMTPFLRGKEVLLLALDSYYSQKRLESAAYALKNTAARLRWATIACEGMLLSQYLQEHRSQFLGLIQSAPGWEPANVPLISTAADLTSRGTPGRIWIMEDLLPSGGLGLLVGGVKEGKSTLARQIAAAVASGTQSYDGDDPLHCAGGRRLL